VKRRKNVPKSRYLRRRRIAQGAQDVERGMKDTERRGTPNDVPSRKNARV